MRSALSQADVQNNEPHEYGSSVRQNSDIPVIGRTSALGRVGPADPNATWQSDSVACRCIEEAWRSLIEDHAAADPDKNWFSPLFEPLLRAAARHAIVGGFYPYQRLNQLCFYPYATSEDLTGNEDFPAIGVGSEGIYAVVDRPGGVPLTETPSVEEALEFIAAILRTP